MGRKFLSSVFFRFLGIGVTIACLNDFGTYPFSSDLLMISVMIGRAESRLFFSKNVGTGSRAHDFDGERSMSFRNSSGVMWGNSRYRLSFSLCGSVICSEMVWSVNCALIFSIFDLKKIRKLVCKGFVVFRLRVNRSWWLICQFFNETIECLLVASAILYWWFEERGHFFVRSDH